MHIPGYYSSGEFARMSGITLRTVRFYDKQNILKPSFVTDSGARFYSDSDFARLQQILLLKYLGFSLDDIKEMTIDDADRRFMQNSMQLQKKLVQDRIEQLQLVNEAIDSTIAALAQNERTDWSQMLKLIHLTGMEKSLKTQYQNASNIAARIRLHTEFSRNKQGWFPWVFSQCALTDGIRVLELGCGNGALWTQNRARIPANAELVLSDISDGMVRDVRRDFAQFDFQISESDAQHSARQDTPASQPASALSPAPPSSAVPTKESALSLDKAQKNAAPRVCFRVFDCARIPYPDASFDLVIANHVLFYCADIGAVCREIRRVLRPNGRFVCSTYGAHHMQEISQLVQDFDSRIVLAAEHLYERFGLENGAALLTPFFSSVERRDYDDAIELNEAAPLIEYILSCHGNQNQYLLDRYSDFRAFVEKKTKRGFHITKEAGLFFCEV